MLERAISGSPLRETRRTAAQIRAFYLATPRCWLSGLSGRTHVLGG